MASSFRKVCSQKLGVIYVEVNEGKDGQASNFILFFCVGLIEFLNVKDHSR